MTSGCNLKCVHCYIPGYRSKSGNKGQLSFNEITRVIDELADLGVIRLILTGGEALSRPDWFEIAKYARGIGFILSLFSNATLIDAEVADRIKELEVEHMEVSLYGSKPEVYELVTAIKGSFAKFLGGIQELKKREIPVWIKPVILKQNLSDLDEMLAFPEKVGLPLKFDQCQLLLPRLDKDSDQLDYFLTDEEMIEVITRQTHVLKSSDNFGICTIASNSLTISANGDVRPCVIHPGVAGNVTKTSLKDIWRNSMLFNQLRTVSVEDLVECKDCDLKPFCTPCIALNVLETGDLTKSKENCRIARNTKKAMQLKGII